MTNEKIEMIQSRIEIQKVALTIAQDELNLISDQRDEVAEELERRENESDGSDEMDIILSSYYGELNQYGKRLNEKQDFVAQIKSELNFLEMMLLIR